MDKMIEQGAGGKIEAEMLKQLKSLDNSEDEAGAFANAIACKLRRMTPYQMCQWPKGASCR